MKEALASNNEREAFAVLIAMDKTTDVPFDRRQFRSLILDHLDSESPAMRSYAFHALHHSGTEHGDLKRVQALEHDPEMHGALTGLLKSYERDPVTLPRR